MFGGLTMAESLEHLDNLRRRSPSATCRVFLHRSANRWTICLLVFSVCFLIFAWRGFGRAAGFSDYAGFNDYGHIYLAARAWLRGFNPYSLNDALATMPPDFPPLVGRRNLLPQLNPPAIFPLYVPFVVFDWGISTM